MKERVYVCIDLKSFYASVECVERGMDPFDTNLAVADPERGKGTICLAVSPAMKKLGVKNRCRVYQIPSHVDYIMAKPRMKLYMEYSANVYAVYLKYIAKEDIHVYSIDEAFLDVTDYRSLYQMSAKELAGTIMADVKNTTGITAAAGIGTNLYLAKAALDIMAKHAADHISFLDEETFREKLWEHRPLTDFWRIGAGTAKKLQHIGILTMKDIAYAEEETLYQMFGIDAELLIDHAWGRETATIADIKSYRPEKTTLSSNQVLARNYDYQECRLIIKEMTDALCLDMLEKKVMTDSISLVLGYSREKEKAPARGTVSLAESSNSYQAVIPYVMDLYEKIADRDMPIRSVNLTCNHVVEEAPFQQYSLFDNPMEKERDRKLQKAVLEIKKKFGKNALVRGMDLQAEGTALERNRQIGGHESGE